jgi:hypothetical protein
MASFVANRAHVIHRLDTVPLDILFLALNQYFVCFRLTAAEVDLRGCPCESTLNLVVRLVISPAARHIRCGPMFAEPRSITGRVRHSVARWRSRRLRQTRRANPGSFQREASKAVQQKRLRTVC